MQLAIFDVDGTLTNTNAVDALCYVEAMSRELGIDVLASSWSDFTCVTDAGITHQLVRDQLGRPPTADELLRVRARFTSLLEESCQRNPELFPEVVGASNALRRLRRDREWAVAIATGSWRPCALVKLRAARIDIDGIPAAFAEDGLSREEIVSAALAQSHEVYRQDHFTKVVSVGDGVWDLETAMRLHLPFVGVDVERGESGLQRRGVSHIVHDFADFELFARTLALASVPRGER